MDCRRRLSFGLAFSESESRCQLSGNFVGEPEGARLLPGSQSLRRLDKMIQVNIADLFDRSSALSGQDFRDLPTGDRIIEQ
jgi:hypothetical protein